MIIVSSDGRMALQGKTIKQSQGAAEEAGSSRSTNKEDPSQVT